jgi:hypothetical protein
MPRQKSLITVIRELVQEEVRKAMAGLLGVFAPKKARQERPLAATARTGSSAGFEDHAPPPSVASHGRRRLPLERVGPNYHAAQGSPTRCAKARSRGAFGCSAVVENAWNTVGYSR